MGREEPILQVTTPQQRANLMNLLQFIQGGGDEGYMDPELLRVRRLAVDCLQKLLEASAPTIHVWEYARRIAGRSTQDAPLDDRQRETMMFLSNITWFFGEVLAGNQAFLDAYLAGHRGRLFGLWVTGVVD